MAYSNDSTQATKGPVNLETATNLLDDAHHAPSGGNDQLTGVMTNSLARRGYALAEGITLVPHGMLNSVQDMWQNPSRLWHSAEVGVAMGVGMRLLGPEANVARLAGGVMAYMMARDAVQPVINTWQAAGDARTMGQVHIAANMFGNGMGNMLVDTGMALGTGLAGSRLAGLGLEGTASGRAFEAWRDKGYTRAGNTINGWLGRDTTNTSLPSQSSGEPQLAGQWLKGLEFKPDRSFAGTAGLDRPSGQAPTGSAASDNVERLLEVNRQVQQRRAGQKVHKNLTEIVDGLLTDKAKPQSPEALGAPATAITSFEPIAHDAPPYQIHEFVRAPRGGTTTSGDRTSQAVGDLAVTIRSAITQVDQNAQALAGFREDIATPIVGAMRDTPAISKAYFRNNANLVALDNQIASVDQAKEVGSLLDHYRVANAQSVLELQDVRDLNLLSKELHDLWPQWLQAHSIPADELLAHEAPQFAIYNVDSPYTIPPIDMRGADGNPAPLTTAGVVAYPRQFQGLDGIHVSGTYEHEILGHNETFRRLFRLPADLRDKVLTDDVVGAALRKNGFDPDAEVKVPVVRNPAPAAGGDGESAATAADNPPGDAHTGVRAGRRGPQNAVVPDTETMTLSNFIVNVLKAQANENTSDFSAELVDPNMGYGLSSLLAALRPPAEANTSGPGLLETRSIYGSSTADPAMGNDLGIEVHGMDRWRIRAAAGMLRWQATHGADVTDAQTMQAMQARADSYDRMAESMSLPGDAYTWANTDAKGYSVSIPQKVLDAIIPDLVRAQMETPMPKSLDGKSIAEVVPPMGPTFMRISGLAARMSAAVRNGQSTLADFDHTQYPIRDVYSAGLQAAVEAIEANPAKGAPGFIAPDEIVANILKMSKNMRKPYSIPEVVPARVAAPTIGTAADAGAIPQPHRAFSTAGDIPGVGAPAAMMPSPYTEIARRFGNAVVRNGPLTAAAYTGGQIGNWLATPLIKDATMSQQIEDLLLRNQDQPAGS